MKKLALIPFVVGCAAKPDFSEYIAFSGDARCSEDPVSDFLLAEDSPLTEAIEASTEPVDDVRYAAYADRSSIDAHSSLIGEEVRSVRLAFYEAGGLLVGYQDRNGVESVGTKDDGDVDGFACDDGTVVAQYMNRNLLIIGRWSFDLDPETLEPVEPFNGSIYYQCPYTPDIPLRSYSEECRKLADFSTNTTSLLCTELIYSGFYMGSECVDYLE